MEEVPKPGSDEALTLGCTCAVMDNNYGKGNVGRLQDIWWWITESCPLHTPEEKSDADPPDEP